MKLRIHGNSIRMRLNQADVAEFAASGRVATYLEFADSSRLTFILTASNSVTEPEARFANDSITVYVPKSRADEWVNSAVSSVRVTNAALGT